MPKRKPDTKKRRSERPEVDLINRPEAPDKELDARYRALVWEDEPDDNELEADDD